MGQDKASVLLQGKPLLLWVLQPLGQVCSGLLVVTSPEGITSHGDVAGGAQLVQDLMPDRGPLGGLYTALQTVDARDILLVGCDTPFLDPDLLRMVSQASPANDATVPVLDGVPQTLHARYSRNCLPVVEGLLAGEGRPGLRRLLASLDVAYLSDDDIDRADPRRLSFFNVNSEADLDRATQFLKGGTL